jgi:hypothetical protein
VVVLAASTLAFGLASCLLIEPLGDLTGRAGDSEEASTDDVQTVGATPEATTDVGAALDAGLTTDAHDPADATAEPYPGPTDTGAPTDAASHPDAVVPGPLFSDNFEGSQALPRGWPTMDVVGGALILDHSLYISPSTSLASSSEAIDAAAPGDAVDVTLRKHFPLPAAGLTAIYDFHAYPRAFDTGGADAVIGALQIGNAAGDLYELQIDTQYAGSAMSVTFAEYGGFADGGSSYVGHPVSATLPVEAWTDIRVELTFSQPPIARVSLGGTLVVETSVNVDVAGTFIQICLGLSYVRPGSASWLINYDDITYTVSATP